MRNDYYSNSKDYLNRWVVSYADLVTMLLALFMVLFAVSQNVTKYQAKQIADHKMEMAGSPMETVNEATDKLEALFKDNIYQNNQIKLLKTNRGLIVRLNNSILFDEGSAIIKEESLKTLNDIIEVLAKIDNQVIIEGHTDSVPIHTEKYPSNWELSTARATNIITYMLKTGKISPKRMSAVGYGEYMPIAENTSSGGRLINRRVDIIILKDINSTGVKNVKSE